MATASSPPYDLPTVLESEVKYVIDPTFSSARLTVRPDREWHFR